MVRKDLEAQLKAYQSEKIYQHISELPISQQTKAKAYMLVDEFLQAIDYNLSNARVPSYQAVAVATVYLAGILVGERNGQRRVCSMFKEIGVSVSLPTIRRYSRILCANTGLEYVAEKDGVRVVWTQGV